jgi:hypothetical protein
MTTCSIQLLNFETSVNVKYWSKLQIDSFLPLTIENFPTAAETMPISFHKPSTSKTIPPPESPVKQVHKILLPNLK